MKLDILTDEELLKLASHQGKHIEDIHVEWYKRHKINFPYLIILDKIYNCILKQIIDDKECDKLILKQANITRKNINQ